MAAECGSFLLEARLCKGCGICAALCPRHVMDRDAQGRPVFAHPEACILCRLCELRCPDFALRIAGKNA